MDLKDALKKIGVSPVRINTGDVCIVKDESVVIPETSPEDRKHHPNGRLAIILSNPSMCRNPMFPIVSVAPLTHRTDLKDECDFSLGQSAENKLNDPSLVMLGHIQPIIKTDIIKTIGRLSDDEWEAMLAHVLSNFDR